MDSVLIVVVTHNAREALKKCLALLRRHTRDVPHRLVVVDNASKDGTRRFLRAGSGSHPGEVLLNSENLGFSGAANSVLRRFRVDWYAFVDDDVFVRAGWLSRLLKAAEQGPRAGIAGCRHVFPDGRIFSAEVMPWGAPAGRGERDRGQRSYRRFSEAVCGACLLVRREVFERVGFFDERFYPCQYEDADFCRRARRAGFRVLYEGGVRSEHLHLSRSGGSAPENGRRFLSKWPPHGSVVRKDTHPIDRAWVRFLAAHARGDLRAALSSCRKLMLLSPVPAYAHYHAGEIFLRQDRWEKARASFGRALGDVRIPSRLRARAELLSAYARWRA